jgi:hypothetical protein
LRAPRQVCAALVQYVRLNNRVLLLQTARDDDEEASLWQHGGAGSGHPAWYYGRCLG